MTVLITGASRGIGRALAVRLAREGGTLALLARSGEGLAETLGAVREAGGAGESFQASVTDESALAAAVARIEAELGPVDVLINNAGLGGPVGELWQLDGREWWQTVEVNLLGTYLCSRAVLPGMVERGAGRIVNVVSNAGAHRWPYFSAYSVSKAAAIKLTENLAAETRPHGIAILAVHPGLVRAGLSEAALAEDVDVGAEPLAEQVRAWFKRQEAAGRTVSAEEAAAFMADVACGRADALSGRYIAIEDDLEALLANSDDVRDQNLHALKVERLSGAS